LADDDLATRIGIGCASVLAFVLMAGLSVIGIGWLFGVGLRLSGL